MKGSAAVSARPSRALRVTLLAALLWLTACLGNQPASTATGTRSAAQRAELERKIGQMLLVGFRGMEVEDSGPITEQIRAGQIGGIVLFDFDVLNHEPQRNIRSPEQVKALVDGLQGLADDVLFVAVDAEGGRVNRLKEQYGFAPTMSQEELGSRGLQAIREQADDIGTTMRELGINVNLAPVVDLNTNRESPAIGALGRSFSNDPKVVTEYAQATIASYHQNGVLTAIKHFPGHGSAKADSHLGFVDVSATWSDAELEPYRSLIDAGMADMVMTAHVFNRKLDPSWPATLSPSIINGLLRKQLGFDGVVLSDDMQMGAITEHYSLKTVLRQTLLAGVDMISFANNNPRAYEPDIAPRAIDVIVSLIEDGTINEARIDQSVMRIQRLKHRLIS